MQFWEDVDEGLNDIEAFFLSSKGMDIDRVRRFAKRYDIRRGLSASVALSPASLHITFTESCHKTNSSFCFVFGLKN
jgi:hypothetical protein